MTAKVVLVTGASRGIGRAIAGLLAQAGYTVYGTSRQPQRITLGVTFDLLMLDVTIPESVQTCIDRIYDQSGRIDVLVNNAGYAIHGAAEETSVEEARQIFETNFFGVQRMINAVLPMMRAQGSGQIINISSIAGLIGTPYLGLYSASKFALEGYTETLRYEVKRMGIQVSLVEPGDIVSDPQSIHTARTVADYNGMRERVYDIHLENMRTGPQADAVAEKVLHIIRSKSPSVRYSVGATQSLGLTLRRILPPGLFERMMRRLYALDKKG